MNIFRMNGMGANEIVNHRDRIFARIISGQRTGLSLSPGMRDEYAEKTEGELKALHFQACEELYRLAPTEYTDPATIARPGVTIPIFY